MGTLRWGTGALDLTFRWSEDDPVTMDSWETASSDPARTEPAPPSSEELWGPTQPLVEVLLLGLGRDWNNTRLTHTLVGSALRHLSHRTWADGATRNLEFVQECPDPRVRVTTLIRAHEGASAIQGWTRIENTGDTGIHVEALSSLSVGCLVRPGATMEDLDVVSGCSAHFAENRWASRPLVGPGGLAQIHPHRHANQCGRGWVSGTGVSTWSTDGDLPTAALADRRTGSALAWQVENDGPWRWEIDARRDGTDSISLVLSGPDDRHHGAARLLAPGEEYRTVPASVAFSSEGDEGAIATLTRHRRWLRSLGPAQDAPIVYNDYMNTLDGDPSQEADLALARAAASVGAEVFCVDAGWYADFGVNWWASVGDWRLSEQRFPAGLVGWCDSVRALGMTPGIWMEPEVAGIDSAAAAVLPESAFLSRSGVRIREQDRYLLDFRDPAARAHVDAAVDRLVTAGIGYFKLDYNVTPGLGSDALGMSPGAGLLDHTRAVRDWLMAVRTRHPDVVIENCSSGAMRSDFARLSLLDLQSTSDQQDPILYPPIAASAPMLMPPEVAGNWAYPQPDMSAEQIAFTMVTGLAGTPYLAGFLDRMSERQLALVGEALDVHRRVRAETREALPFWPLGLPGWDDPVVVLGLHCAGRDLVYVWDRTGSDHIDLDIGADRNQVRTLYPVDLPAWGIDDIDDRPGSIRLRPARRGLGDSASARLLEVMRD